ncbi:MAG: hypothetical protein EOP08_06520, partial [Proteobacteria bacterium]
MLSRLLDLLAPPECPACRLAVARLRAFCPACAATIRRPEGRPRLDLELQAAFLYGGALSTAIAAIALLGRRFGARAAGFMSGFPIIGGPIVYFVYWDQGASFALKAAEATLAGVVGLSSFSFVYAWLAPRASWWLCLAVGWIVYAGLGAGLAQADLGADIYAAMAGIILLAQLHWARPVTQQLAPSKTSTAEIISRMLFAALLVLAVTLLAARLGAM